jgi:putative heme-binding domain-containing protein
MDVLVRLEGRPQQFDDAHLLSKDETFRVTAQDPFIPAVQPGATIDWKPEPAPVESDPAARTIAVLGHTLPLVAGMTRVPWAGELSGDAGKPAARELPGNWLAGRRVFFSSEAACFTCHQIRGEGIAVGADLTNLIHRDRDSVLADILQPSASINPDHPASMVKLKGGASLTGIIRTANDREVKVMLQMGAVQTLARGDVESMELLKTSLMPEGYADRLIKDQQTDLLKFLLTNPLEPAPIERTDPPAPAPRKRAELDAILSKAPAPPATYRPAPPLKILLAAGPKDHGPGEHDYPLWQKRWTTLLRLAHGVTVDTAWEFPKPEQLAAADVTVFFSKNPGFNPRTAMLLDDYQKRGGGLVYLHWAVNGDEHAQVLAERIGLAGGKFGVKFRHGEFDLAFTQPEHPVTKGFPTLHFTDETYWAMQGDVNRIKVLGTGVEEGEPRPQLWALEREKGRVIGCVPGHYTWTFDDPLFRLLVLRAICWTGKQEYLDRLSELATVGARIVP